MSKDSSTRGIREPAWLRFGARYRRLSGHSTHTSRANRGLRIGFVTGLTNAQLAKPVRPGVAFFAKGDEAQKLIVVALEEGYIDTLYRTRAFFAMMTAVARTLPIFEQHGVEEWFTFYDLCKMLGFELITFTNGNDFAYQVELK